MRKKKILYIKERLQKQLNQLLQTMFKKEIDIVFDDLVNIFIKENGGFGFIGKFAINLKNSGNTIGNLIVNEHKQF